MTESFPPASSRQTDYHAVGFLGRPCVMSQSRPIMLPHPMRLEPEFRRHDLSFDFEEKSGEPLLAWYAVDNRQWGFRILHKGCYNGQIVFTVHLSKDVNEDDPATAGPWKFCVGRVRVQEEPTYQHGWPVLGRNAITVCIPFHGTFLQGDVLFPAQDFECTQHGMLRIFDLYCCVTRVRE